MSALVTAIPSWFIPAFIIVVSIIALTVILERGYTLMKYIKPLQKSDQRQLLKFIDARDFTSATDVCQNSTHPGHKVILAILEEKDSNIELQNLAEEETNRQLIKLEKFLPTLGTISTVAPLLGLLGTVTGMIKSFKAFEKTASRNAELMGGIDEALITTALGLMVGIPALIIYNYFTRRVNSIMDETNILVQMVIDSLKK